MIHLSVFCRTNSPSTDQSRAEGNNTECVGKKLIILIGNDFNSNSELQITIRKKNDVVPSRPCPKGGDVTHAHSQGFI
jgi:hypothetical protein